jgi:hypothetical protein
MKEDLLPKHTPAESEIMYCAIGSGSIDCRRNPESRRCVMKIFSQILLCSTILLMNTYGKEPAAPGRNPQTQVQ